MVLPYMVRKGQLNSTVHYTKRILVISCRPYLFFNCMKSIRCQMGLPFKQAMNMRKRTLTVALFVVSMKGIILT